MSAFELIPIRAFSDEYIWTIRDAASATVVDRRDAKAVIDFLGRRREAHSF